MGREQKKQGIKTILARLKELLKTLLDKNSIIKLFLLILIALGVVFSEGFRDFCLSITDNSTLILSLFMVAFAFFIFGLFSVSKACKKDIFLDSFSNMIRFIILAFFLEMSYSKIALIIATFLVINIFSHLIEISKKILNLKNME